MLVTVTSTTLALSTTIAAPAPASAHHQTETTTVEVQECHYEYKRVGRYRMREQGSDGPFYEWVWEWKRVEVCEWVQQVVRTTIPHRETLLKRIAKKTAKFAVCGGAGFAAGSSASAGASPGAGVFVAGAVTLACEEAFGDAIEGFVDDRLSGPHWQQQPEQPEQQHEQQPEQPEQQHEQQPEQPEQQHEQQPEQPEQPEQRHD